MAITSLDQYDDSKPHRSERKKNIQTYYLNLLEESPTWHRHKDKLLYFLSIDADNIFSEYPHARQIACYPTVCRKVAYTILKKHRTQYKGRIETPLLLDVLSISLLELINLLKNDTNTRETDNPERLLFINNIARTERQYWFLVGARDSKGATGNNIYNGEDVLFDFLLEGKDNVVDFKHYKDTKLFEKADRFYFARTGKDLSLLELDNFEQVLSKAKNKHAFFSLQEVEKIGELIEALKSYFVISKGKPVSPRGVLHTAIREAALEGCIAIKDFENYLERRGVLYEVGELGHTVYSAFQNVGMMPPQKPKTRYEKLSQEVYSVMDQGYLETDCILEQLKSYDIPAYYSSLSYQSFKNIVSGMRSEYLKRKKEKPTETKASKLKPYSRDGLIEAIKSVSINYQKKRLPSDYQKVQEVVVDLLEEGIEKTATIREHLQSEKLLGSYDNQTRQQLTVMISGIKNNYKKRKTSPNTKELTVLEVYKERSSE